jgi:hypothetical protein
MPTRNFSREVVDGAELSPNIDLDPERCRFLDSLRSLGMTVASFARSE